MFEPLAQLHCCSNARSNETDNDEYADEFHSLTPTFDFPKYYILLIQRFGYQRDVLFARCLLFVVGFDPVFPVLSGGAVFAGEL